MEPTFIGRILTLAQLAVLAGLALAAATLAQMLASFAFTDHFTTSLFVVPLFLVSLPPLANAFALFVRGVSYVRSASRARWINTHQNEQRMYLNGKYYGYQQQQQQEQQQQQQHGDEIPDDELPFL